MDIAALIALLIRNREFEAVQNILLAQWGPLGRTLIGANFMPPRLLEDNAGTIERVSYYTVAAPDTSRYSPAPLVTAGEMFGSIRYNLGDAKLAREFTGADYDGVLRMLARNQTMEATALVVGWSDTALLQALVERDEFKIWQVLTSGGFGRFGDNGFVELVDGPDLQGQFVTVAEDWSDPTVNPYPTIEGRIKRLTDLGFDPAGIRIVMTNQIATILRNNPYTALRAGKSALVTKSDGTIITQPVPGLVDNAMLDTVFTGMGVQAPVRYDARGFTPGHTQRRFYPEGNMTFMGATGVNEEVAFNVDGVEDVRIVTDAVGFLGIGRANGQVAPGRRVIVRPELNTAAARLEGEAWETADPILMNPQAVCGLSGIQ